MKPLLPLTLLLLALAPLGCDVQDGAPGSSQTLASTGAGNPDEFERIHDAPLQTLFGGIRRVEQAVTLAGVPLDHVYRESVIADGQGSFAVDVLEILEPPMTGNQRSLALMQLASRAGFSYRYRDFRINDLDLFFDNYRVIHSLNEPVVAGRTCNEFRVMLEDDPQRVYWIAEDQQTGILLHVREEDAATGQVLSRMEYETFTTVPDLQEAVFFQQVQERSIDPQSEAAGALLGFQLARPQVVPDGYQLRSAVQKQDPVDPQRNWAILTYGDGVEQVFFMHGGPVHVPGTSKIGPGLGAQGLKPQGANDTIQSFELGSWRVLQGTVRSEQVMIVGKAQEADLLMMVESAFY